MEELVINIWIFIDLETELAYNWCGKVYSLSGTDEEKYQVLRSLAFSDYKTTPRVAFPENVKAIRNGKDLAGYIPSSAVNNFFEQYPDLFINELEKSLPPLLFLNSKNLMHSNQTLPEDPLYVLTKIYEKENGFQRPIITEDDRIWLQSQRFLKGSN
jgi:hypothetical protein